MTHIVPDEVLETIATDARTTDVFLTSRPLRCARAGRVHGVTSPEHRSAIVGVPEAAGSDRFDPEVARRVLDLVLHELVSLQAAV